MKEKFLAHICSILVCMFSCLASDKSYIPSFVDIEYRDIAALMRLLRAKENLLLLPNTSKALNRIKKVDKASYKIEQLVFKSCELLDHRSAYTIMCINKAWYKKITEHRKFIVTEFNKKWPCTFFKLPGLESNTDNQELLRESNIKRCRSSNCVDLSKKEEKLLKLCAKDGSSFVYIHPATVQFDASGNLASGYAVDLLDSFYFDEHGNYVEPNVYKRRYLSSMWGFELCGNETRIELDYNVHPCTPYKYIFDYTTCVIKACIEAGKNSKMSTFGIENNPRIMYAAATDTSRKVMFFASTMYESDHLERFIKGEGDSYNAYITICGWHSSTSVTCGSSQSNLSGVMSKPQGPVFVTTSTFPFSIFPLYVMRDVDKHYDYSCGFRPDGTCCFASDDTGFMVWAQKHLKTWQGVQSDLGMLAFRCSEEHSKLCKDSGCNQQ